MTKTSLRDLYIISHHYLFVTFLVADTNAELQLTASTTEDNNNNHLSGFQSDTSSAASAGNIKKVRNKKSLFPVFCFAWFYE